MAYVDDIANTFCPRILQIIQIGLSVDDNHVFNYDCFITRRGIKVVVCEKSIGSSLT